MKCFVLLAVLGFAQISLTYGAECQADTTWSTPCHECSCSKEGLAKCSPKSCQDESGSSARPPHCKAGSRWKDDCNTCFCTEDGFAACTKIGCVSIKPPAGLNFDDSVRPKESVPLPLEGKSDLNKTVVCEAKTAFRKDCNMCWCNDDGTSYFCTRKVCVPNLDDDTSDQHDVEQRVIEKECRPSEVFEQDCNTCRCNDDGKSFSCTARACVTDSPPDTVYFEAKISPPVERRVKRQTEPTKPTVKVCEPSVEFRQDCNRCLCHTDGLSFSCTRLECHPKPEPKPTSTRRRREVAKKEARDCEPGSVFQQGCNVCRCESDGQHATCALKRCPITHKDSDDKEVESDSGFRCTPGEQFKRSCNDCTCSADGKSIFCTIKLCEKEIVSQL